MPAKNKSGLQVSWTTVTYRSVVIAVGVVLLLAGFVLYLLFPQQSKNLAERAANAISDWLGKKG